MDIRGYNLKRLPYRFVLFYNLPADKLIEYRAIYQGTETDNALLTYCYLDRTCGLSYKAICWGYVADEGEIEYHHARKMTVGLTIREGGLECDAAVFDEDEMMFFKEEADKIKDIYGYLEDRIAIRDDVPFDEYRHPSYPKDILVWFFAKDKKLEKIWVTETDRHPDGSVSARLLNEPYNPLMGVHEGDVVEVVQHDTGNGKIIPAVVLPWMKK